MKSNVLSNNASVWLFRIFVVMTVILALFSGLYFDLYNQEHKKVLKYEQQLQIVDLENK